MNNKQNKNTTDTTTNKTSFSILARVASDIDLQFTPNKGKVVANFSVCELIPNEDTQKPAPCYMNAKAWVGVAEAIENKLRKGDLVRFTVEVKNNNFTTKDGTKVDEIYYLVRSFYFIKGSERQARLAKKHDGTNALATVTDPKQPTTVRA